MLERLCETVVERRRALFAIWWIHVWILHYLILGFISWDAYGYRGVPLVELLQHGNLGAGKYDDWAQVAYTPFVELVHLPFLAVFGLRGLVIGFPVIVFPLCVLAVYRCVRELTSSERAGTFGAIAYAAMPMVNQQPFAGYIDFAVTGLLAYFVYAVLRARAGTGRMRHVRVAIATFLFTMARSHGFYIVIVVFPVIAYVLWCERHRFRIRIPIAARRQLALVTAAVAIGALPCLGLQIYKLVVHGSPIAPMQLQILGFEIGRGVPLSTYFQYAGIGGDDLASLWRGFRTGWIWNGEWPVGAFFAGGMGAGLLFLLAAALLPRFLRTATRLERWLLAIGVVVSVMSKDFALPRYSYTTMLAIAMICGRALPGLLADGARARFAAAAAVLALHLLRPELDIVQLRSGYLSPRMNVGGSPFYARGANVWIYPSGHHRFVIVDYMTLTLPVFGRRLSNEVIASVPSIELGAHCANLERFVRDEPGVLFVDEHDRTKDCRRRCALPHGSDCGAWRIEPGLPPR